jgi:hypothetical protein
MVLDYKHRCAGFFPLSFSLEAKESIFVSNFNMNLMCLILILLSISCAFQTTMELFEEREVQICSMFYVLALNCICSVSYSQLLAH